MKSVATAHPDVPAPEEAPAWPLDTVTDGPADEAGRRRRRLEAAMDAARRYLDASLAKKTRTAYLGDWRAWIAWCEATDTAAALPAADEALAVWLASDGALANSTLRRRLSAVRLVHARAGRPLPPQLPACRAVLRGHAHETRERGVRRQDALTVDRLVAVLDAIGADGPAATADAVRDAAMLLVGFDAALRPSELARLDLAHLAPLDADVVLDVPWSKADQAGEGACVAIRPQADPRYCPVAALRRWCTVRERLLGPAREGPVFVALGTAAMYRARTKGADPLSTRAIERMIKRRAEAAGLEGAYAGHSPRRGRITSAIRAGAPFGQVREHARHRHISTTFGYVESAGAIARHPPIVIGTSADATLPMTNESGSAAAMEDADDRSGRDG